MIAAVAIASGCSSKPTKAVEPSTVSETVQLVDSSHLMYVGDYSTGDFSQWANVQNRFYNSTGSGYSGTLYPATIVDDPARGKVARYEVRTGDIPDFGGGERSEVAGEFLGTGIYWCWFATKFDPSFPTTWAEDYWGVTNQWHPSEETAIAPPLAFGYNGSSGHMGWELSQKVNNSDNNIVIWRTPIDVGNWHEIKMQINFSPDPAVGWIRLWHGGVPQTFINGETTWHGQTMATGSTQFYYKEGLYRGSPTIPTGIVYHAGFRSATDEASL
jgi:hypothetical protein